MLVLLPLAAVGTLAWVASDEAALARVLQHLPGVQLQGLRGRLHGGPFALDRLRWQGAGLRVEVDDLAWDDARWTWRPHPGAWLGLTLQRPTAARVRLTTQAGAPASARPQPPQRWTPPFALSASGLHVNQLLLDEQPPIEAIQADLRIGADGGRQHRLDHLVAQRDGLVLRGQAVLGSQDPMLLQLQLDVAAASPPGAGPPWQAVLRAEGPLQQPGVTLDLQHVSGATARLQATLAPWAAWPVRALSAQAQDLDLAAWVPQGPHTRLSGRAVLAAAPATADAPAVVELSLDNTMPGAWDRARLPLRQLTLRLQGRPGEPGALRFERFDVELAGSEGGPRGQRAQPAGRLQGQGHWVGSRLELQLALQAVQTRRLHGGAPAATLDGQLNLQVQGWPAPTAAAAGAVPALATGAQSAVLDLALSGRLPRRGAPLMALQARLLGQRSGDGSLQLLLERAQARTGADGPANLTASAKLQRSPALAWTLSSQGTVQGLDPADGWPALAPGPGPHRLNGRWQADLGWDGRDPAGPWPTLRGDARVQLDDSRWAGLPWQGTLGLQARGPVFSGNADLQAGPNRLRAEGRLARAPGRQPELQARVDLQAPRGAALAPVAALLPAALAPYWPVAGSASLQGQLDGRWPQLRSQGRLSLQGLRAPAYRVGQAQARWELSNHDLQAPLQLSLQARQMAQGERRIDQLDLLLQGQLREHSLLVRASSPLRPPAWMQASAAAPGPAGSQFLLRAGGAWAPVAGGGGVWAGHVAQLSATPRGPSTAPAWLSATALGVELRLGATGALQQARLAPGRITAFDGALRWEQALWQAAPRPGATPRLQLQASLEPMAVAPWLARFQPRFGWRGDLALAGRIRLDSGERFDAEVQLERSRGDLSLSIDGQVRALELTQLRAGLRAQQGRWELTQLAVSRSVGALSGAQQVRTDSRLAWPDARAPVTGGLAFSVPDLALWAPWLPPGWRVGGALRASAAIGGQVGAPEYRGELLGENLLVRHLFEGIHLRQGTLSVALNGHRAELQRLEIRDAAGQGVLRVQGGATFGSTPRAQLRAELLRLRLLDRVDRRLIVSGAADLDLQAARLAVRGNLSVDEGLIDATAADAPSLPSDVVVLNRAPLRATAAVAAAAPPAQPPGPPRSPLGQADVDLRMDLGPALRLRGRGLDTLLRGQLRVTTPGGQLAVHGSVDVAGGTYTAYGQNLRIERGLLDFSGPVATPRLDVLALRADIDTRVGVVVSGSVALPRVRLYSEPELGQLDTLTWLLLGRAPEGLGRDDTALLQRAALALLAGERTDRSLVQRLGLDELSLRRGTGDGASATIVSLGKQISRRVFIGYEQALGAASGTLNLIYRIAGRLTLRARTGSEPSVDAIWTWRWN